MAAGLQDSGGIDNDVQFRRAGIIVGVLFIVATVFLFVGEAFYRAHIEHPDALTVVAQHKPAIIVGLLFEFICILAMPMIGAFIYPVLRRVSDGMALAYFFFRSLEAIILVSVALVNKLSVLSLSEAVAAGADPEAASGAMMLITAQNNWGNTDGAVYNIVFVLGAACLYTTLYRSRLIPRWLSGWGLLAIAIHLVLVISAIFLPMPAWSALLLLPIAVQEMAMAVWFIVRGFDFSSHRAATRGVVAGREQEA